MAITQEQDWRVREAINKRIERQIEQGLVPLTKYKTLFPFTEGGDIIDRRTGKIKTVATFVRQTVTKSIGTQAAFVAKQKAKGVSATRAKELYREKKAAKVRTAKESYSEKLGILAGMDVTKTSTAKDYTAAMTDYVVGRFLEWLRIAQGARVRKDPTVGPPEDPYTHAVNRLAKMSMMEKLEMIRYAKRRSTTRGKRTGSFYQMIGDYLDLDLPKPPSP